MDSIMEQLPSLEVDVLEQLCVACGITVAEEKKGKKALLKMELLGYLAVEGAKADTGEETCRKVDVEIAKHLKTKLKKEAAAREEMKEEGGQGGTTSRIPNIKLEVKEDHHDSPADKTKMEMIRGLKLSQFKVTGAVGTSDGCIDFRNLNFQIQDGLSQGYKFKEIRTAVIKAIKAGTSMKKYFEGAYEIDDQEFTKMLRSYYKVQDATTLFNQMVSSAQEPNEMEMDFVLRLMDLRNNIITLSKEEGCPFDETMVRKKFVHALSVGFTEDIVRLELRNVLKDHDITDHVLLEEVNIVMQREAEHKKKVKGQVKAGVKAVEPREAGRDLSADVDALKNQVAEMIGAFGELNEKFGGAPPEVWRYKFKQNRHQAWKEHGRDEVDEDGNCMTAPVRGSYRPYRRGRGGYPVGRGGGGAQDGGDGAAAVGARGRGAARGVGRGGDGGRGNAFRGGRGRNVPGYTRHQYHPAAPASFIKCQACQGTGDFCVHCTTCGEEGHRRNECPLN